MQAQVGQDSLDFDGQVSGVGSYAPDNALDLFVGVRYIPRISYGFQLDSATAQRIDFEASANVAGSFSSNTFESVQFRGRLAPYRLWARYTRRQFEFRVGLQKIDFGAATLLRPLQWFNEIDPRDPLQLTNGVYGALVRYYFLNNANIWLWGLYGNKKTRGFDAVETNRRIPEYGGRVQLPAPRGEIGVSYHHRTANTQDLSGVQPIDKIPENRIGLDGKWDLGIGLWFEASYVHKARSLGLLTNQALLNVGADYTFGIGNGLNVVLENLILNFSEKNLEWNDPISITAMNVSYPLGLFDNLSWVGTYNWTTRDPSLFVNFQHQFPKITTYIMAFYNPRNQLGIRQNELVNTFAGPGLRLMLVYNN
ncbi:hypothetical protein GBK04_02050 [Cytophagaceae bacterium SJW1-29]|uniref:Uncharacterized protein n=1 Tax=Salmonirosea aquatica TaxID=2654236 RepID=A0A7C9BMJ2_9BACT|nr:hypothetical protein [Cytophagaceae bacterium SJW1-29]